MRAGADCYAGNRESESRNLSNIRAQSALTPYRCLLMGYKAMSNTQLISLQSFSKQTTQCPVKTAIVLILLLVRNDQELWSLGPGKSCASHSHTVHPIS